MLRYHFIALSLLSVAISTIVMAGSPHRSDYAGQERRIIKSLSIDDIQQLQAGKGWGLAKAAELNGVPGPAHVLQMKDKISLTKEQEIKIQALFEDMKLKAVPLGVELIEMEKRLNDSFANGVMTNELLNQQLDSISEVYKKLRYVHLATHLMTPKVLTPQQIQKYNRLRGYHSGDPCQNIPEGHNMAMWKKHNGCD